MNHPADPLATNVAEATLPPEESARRRFVAAPGDAALRAGTVEFVADAPPAEATHALAHDDTADAKAVRIDPETTVDPEAGKLIESDNGSRTAPAVPRTVAGYEILGVLGRGAMGVVYKARQRGLNRLVALKMILSGAHASEHELARFRTEAEAVARVQHQNIVQIYEIGEEEGRPFFSLEYVDGGSLAAKIHGDPQPPAEAARLVHLLAGAMDCAHGAGVAHRDLKPANVLLTRDGAPKITDFGLAKRMEGDSVQTHSGSILGSPGYMAPEQAEGKTHEVGPLADVYALGVILYELLTGRIPFRAPTVLETLELIRTHEPPSPADLQPTVPRDLETICLKCLQKDPRRRYDGAGALAEDLRRFLNQEPIRARPVGRGERAWRWCRRNPRLALMGATMALVVVAWAVSMSVLARGLMVETAAKDAALADATDKKQLAERNAADAREKKELADQNAAAAKANAKRAGDVATVAVRRMTDTAARVEKKLDGRLFASDAAPELRALRNDLVNQLREGMVALAKDIEGAKGSSFATVAIYQQMGDTLKRLGKGEEAVQQYRLGADLVRKIAREQPDDDKARANLCVMLKRLGEMELELNGAAAAAHDYFEEACTLTREIADHPRSGDYTDLDNKRLLSHYELALGQADLARGDAAAAAGHIDKALALRKAWSEAQPTSVEARSYVAEAHYWRGQALGRLGDAKASREAFDEAVRVCKELAAKYPGDTSFKADVADVVGGLGDARLNGGMKEEAEKSYRDSLDNLRAALERAPENVDYQVQRARAEERLAAVAAAKGDRAAAQKGYQEALRLRRDLLDIEPNNLTWQAACMLTLAHCGKEGEAAKKADELRQKRPTSVSLQLDAARCYAVLAGATDDAAAKRRHVDRAAAALRAAAKAGCKDVAAWKTDPDLAQLQEEAPYRSLLDELAKR